MALTMEERLVSSGIAELCTGAGACFDKAGQSVHANEVIQASLGVSGTSAMYRQRQRADGSRADLKPPH